MTDLSPAPDAAPIDPAVEAALAASARRPGRGPAGVRAHPQHLGAARARAGHGRGRGVGRGPPAAASGRPTSRSCATALHPIVYGRIHEAPGAPTALVYCHYDVQPVDPVELWETAPFEPFLRDGRFVGPRRGRRQGPARDAPLGARGAARGRQGAGGQPHVRVRGRGGVRLRQPVRVDRRRTATAWRRTSRSSATRASSRATCPAITVGLRGIMYAQIDVELSPVDLHSGMYGGTVENPANALARIIAALKGPDGRIRIPGFYDDVVAADRRRSARRWPRCPFDDEAYRAEIPVPALVGEAGWTTLERKGARPTLDVNGMWGGFQGEGAKTIIPAHAHAKVSTRLVANQDPATVFAALRDYVAEIAPPGVTVTHARTSTAASRA